MEDSSYKVIFYATPSGQVPINDFLDLFQNKVRAKIIKWIQKLKQEGPNLPRPYADIVVGKIRELRIVFASNQYRILYFFFGKTIVLTHGFLKKSDKVPPLEIKRAENYMAEFLDRNQGAN